MKLINGSNKADKSYGKRTNIFLNLDYSRKLKRKKRIPIGNDKLSLLIHSPKIYPKYITIRVLRFSTLKEISKIVNYEIIFYLKMNKSRSPKKSKGQLKLERLEKASKEIKKKKSVFEDPSCRQNLSPKIKTVGDGNLIIKWNLPIDLIIEILSFTDNREFEYLLTFDSKCSYIKTDSDLYSRLMVRRLQRYINPILSSFDKPWVVDVPLDTLKRGLKLFEDLPPPQQLEYASYYAGKMETQIVKCSSMCMFECGMFLNYPDGHLRHFEHLTRGIIAIDLDREDILKKILAISFSFSLLSIYLKKYGCEKTLEFIKSLEIEIRIPKSVLTDEIVKKIEEKVVGLIMDIIQTANFRSVIDCVELLFRQHITDPSNVIDIDILGSLLYKDNENTRILENVLNHEIDKIPSKDISDIKFSVDTGHLKEGLQYVASQLFIYGCCRDNKLNYLTSIFADKPRLMLKHVFTHSLSHWPIIDVVISRLQNLDDFLAIIYQFPPIKILEKVAIAAVEKLSDHDYLQLVNSGRQCNCCFFPPYINPIFISCLGKEKYLKLEEEHKLQRLKKQREEKQRKKEEEQREKERTKKIKKLVGTSTCLWKYAGNPEKVCTKKITKSSLYFCSSHIRCKEAKSQEYSIKDLLLQGYTSDDNAEMVIHLLTIDENIIDPRHKTKNSDAEDSSEEDRLKKHNTAKSKEKDFSEIVSSSEDDSLLDEYYDKKVTKKKTDSKVSDNSSDSEKLKEIKKKIVAIRRKPATKRTKDSSDEES